MRRANHLAMLAWAGLLVGANGGEWVFAGVFLAVAVLLCLPALLLVHAWRPGLISNVAEAYEQRKTAAALFGAGAAIAVLLLAQLFAAVGAGFVSAVLGLALCLCFLLGFAACSRRQGLRLLRLEPDASDDDARRVKPLVIGWLARAGAVAVPLLWPLVGAYLAATAVGAPIVAWLESRRGDGE